MFPCKSELASYSSESVRQLIQKKTWVEFFLQAQLYLACWEYLALNLEAHTFNKAIF